MVERTLISLPSQLQLIERLQHLIYLSSSLIFVSGQAGSGKSTLTENLSNALPADLQQVYVSLLHVPSAEKLRQQIVSQLFDKALFNAEDKLIDSITRLQQAENRTHNRLIIIDHAEHLPADFITELCELFADSKLAQDNTLNVLLLSDAETIQQHLSYIDTHLPSRSKAFLNHVELTLPALSAQEAKALLQHNFQQVDYQAKLQHQDALNKQLKRCAGNPQKIIKLADDLSQGLLKPITTSWVKTKLPAIALMLVLVAIVSVLAVYLYPKFIPNQSYPEAVIDESYRPLEEINALEPENVNVESPSLPASANSAAISTANSGPEKLAASWADLDLDINDNQSLVGLSDATEERVVISGEQLLQLTVATEQEQVETGGEQLIEPPVTEVTPIDNEQSAPLLLQRPIDSETLLEMQDTENTDKNIEAPLLTLPEQALDEAEKRLEQEVASSSELPSTSIDVEPATVADVSAEPANENEKVQLINVQEAPPVQVNEVIAATEQEDSLFTKVEILLAKDPTHYTLQISGMASREYLTEFQKQYNPSQADAYIYQTVRQGKPWYVIIYGDYDSINAAQLAAKNLPGVFKNMSSWVKKWQVVHNDLRLNNE